MSELNVGALIQARMDSSRLPGKVLRPLVGHPTLIWLLERLQRAQQVVSVVVATSTESTDEPIVEFCEHRGIECERGPLGDVGERLVSAAERRGWDAFVRVNADSPFLDQALVDHGVGLFREGGSDLVTNVFPRSFPPGQSVEVIKTSVYRSLLADIPVNDREHVTKALYREPTQLKIRNFAAEADFTEWSMTLDRYEDIDAVERVLRQADRPMWSYGWRELVEAFKDLSVAHQCESRTL